MEITDTTRFIVKIWKLLLKILYAHRKNSMLTWKYFDKISVSSRDTRKNGTRKMSKLEKCTFYIIVFTIR